MSLADGGWLPDEDEARAILELFPSPLLEYIRTRVRFGYLSGPITREAITVSDEPEVAEQSPGG